MRNGIKLVGSALFLFFQLAQGQSLGRVGSATDVVTTATAGTVLMGGGSDVDAAFTWMINKSGGGDFVVIRATGTNAYNSYILGLGPANSVETFLINSVAQANDPALVETIKKAEAVFFAGGNQNDYIANYRGTALGSALDYLANTKHVPIGGTSAGMAIQGSIYYDGNTNVLSPDVLPNPYLSGSGIHYNDFFQNPFLQKTICDTHFNTKGGTTTNGITGRQGRLMTFLSRMITDQNMTEVKAIACDEKTAVCIDENGLGMVVGLGKAYFLRQWCNVPETCVSGQALTWSNGVKVYKISGPGSYTAAPAASKSVDLTNWTTVTGGDYEYWTVNSGVLTIGQTTATPSVCTILNVSEAIKNDPIQIYPNPSNGTFRVVVAENNATITILDVLGKTIKQQQAIGNSCDVKLELSGCYFVHVTTASGTTIKKLIVKE
ncbi:MAG: hypothetical protein CFE24_07010 [Flavobacterium sp. BFFFF2]|nr:MAG: hypothetical protein CFE24_07010 [Flavobacterium sp. BFFFF2]